MGLLVFTRHPDEDVIVGDGTIRIIVVEVKEGRVKLGIEAPREIPVHRGEVYRAMKAEGSVRSLGGRHEEKK